MYAPLDEQDDYRVNISRVESELTGSKTFSSNKAYAFQLSDPVFNEEAQSFHREVLVFNERRYLVKVRFPGVRDINDIRWINERLLYIRAWRGRTRGTDIVIDVESESVTHQEPFGWGEIAFEQFKQCAEKPWSDEPRCKCATTSKPKRKEQRTNAEIADQ